MQDIQSTTAKVSSNYCQSFCEERTSSMQSHESSANLAPVKLLYFYVYIVCGMEIKAPTEQSWVSGLAFHFSINLFHRFEHFWAYKLQVCSITVWHAEAKFRTASKLIQKGELGDRKVSKTHNSGTPISVQQNHKRLSSNSSFMCATYIYIYIHIYACFLSFLDAL